jgi:acetyl esterase
MMNDRPALRGSPWFAALLASLAMGSAVAASTTEELAYRSDAGMALPGTLYRPGGSGPFPLVVYVHGGGWTSSTRAGVQPIAQALADDGIAVYAIDFRMPPAAGYPASIRDVNLAVRWVKAHASQLATRADWVGLMGESSGAHQAVLVAMRPTDSVYSDLPLAAAPLVDASVPFVVSCWGVLDPLARYRYAQEQKLQMLVAGHDSYWGSEKNMAEGNPQLLLDRHDAVSLPRLLAIYGTADRNVPTAIPERFVSSYRQAGGQVEALPYAGAAHAFITPPFDARSLEALASIRRFVHQVTDTVPPASPAAVDHSL